MIKHKVKPVDIEIGARLRLARTTVGMSQEKLGLHLGVTFQQIQKYEKGLNRLSVSSLCIIAEFLNCEPSTLFPTNKPVPQIKNKKLMLDAVGRLCKLNNAELKSINNILKAFKGDENE